MESDRHKVIYKIYYKLAVLGWYESLSTRLMFQPGMDIHVNCLMRSRTYRIPKPKLIAGGLQPHIRGLRRSRVLEAVCRAYKFDLLLHHHKALRQVVEQTDPWNRRQREATIIMNKARQIRADSKLGLTLVIIDNG